MSQLVDGNTPCRIELKAECNGKANIYYCKPHNQTYTARPGHKKCPFGRQGAKGQMVVWTSKEVEEALKK